MMCTQTPQCARRGVHSCPFTPAHQPGPACS
jgi:hypothetical protein